MTKKELAELLRKLKRAKEEGLGYTMLLTEAEAKFLLELITKSWRDK